MASPITPLVNASNVLSVREQIALKTNPNPFHATVAQSASVLTDFDTFPYPRYYRGIPETSVPIVAEREAGWRERHDSCYQPKIPHQLPLYPNHCFSTSCSSTAPCYPEYASRYADLEQMQLFLNNKCITQYR
jgi:hypothetical protein